MILAANQPYFIPYIGYWQLIKSADVFSVDDNFNYIKKGWINRNRILINSQPHYFILPIKSVSSNKLIQDLYLSEFNLKKLYRTIECSYGKAPNFESGFELMKDILSFQDHNLAEFLYHSISVMCDYLEINTKLIKTSSLAGNELFKREHRIYDQCDRQGFDTYINSIGGMELYDFEEFKKRGITLKFLKAKPIEYKQFNHPFVPNLSILDVIMFNSREEVIKMLDSYELVESSEK